MEKLGLYALAWLQTKLQEARELTEREEGFVAMEYVVIAAVVIVLVAGLFRGPGQTAITGIINDGLGAIAGVV
jgi:hypothetical protein